MSDAEFLVPSIDSPVAQAIRQYAAEQLHAIDTNLIRRGGERHVGIHEARKAIRRFRAVLALCGPASEDAAYALDQAVRRVGKSLSKLRDAHVVVQTATKHLKRRELTGKRDAWRALRDALKQRRDKLTLTALTADREFVRRRTNVAKFQKRLAALAWAPLTPEGILVALRRSSARVRRAEQDAKRQPTLIQQHRWRRRVRRLRMQLQCIAEIAHREAVVKDVQIQARWILREALETMPSIDTLNALATCLGSYQDAKLLRDVVRRETPVPNHEVLLEALQVKLLKKKRLSKATNDRITSRLF